MNVLVLAVMLCAGAELDLSGVWNLSGTDEAGAPVKCPIAIPGDTHTALLAAGKIVDPYWGSQETNVQWVGRQDWTVSRTFDVPDGFLLKRQIILRLEDCDTFCTVRVNGHSIGETSDRFRRYEFDVKPYLKSGANVIEGRFASAERIGNERRAQGGRAFPMSNVPWAKNQALVRKPACHAGWDWGPAQMLMGFCGTTKLIASDGPRIDYVRSMQAFNDDMTHCTLTVVADLSDGTAVTNTVEIDDPPLWWPNGAGPQSFYTYSVKVGNETLTRRIGLRKIEVLNEKSVLPDGKEGLSMVFRVNGRRLFMKGANWIPGDAFESRQTSRYRNLLESAAAANMNMIRLWGGGQYERDAFYEICDELGLLVWHDMMHSCAVYPADEAFLGDIRGELSHQLRRLHDHACIALWCGDNECLGAINWFPETRKEKPFYREQWIRRSRLQGELVARYDPSRTYWPSSPCCGPEDFGDAWKEDSRGDMHNWQVWHENRPFDAYYAYSPRFCSEFGYQSFPSMEVAETFATREEILARAPAFEWHQKNPGGNRRIRETMLRYFQPPKDVESELLLSQFQQAMAIKMAVDGWRAQRPRCMGTLYWQLNDNWPVASWSSIEYGGKWKPLHHLARRFYAPVAVVAQPEITNGKADVTKGKVFALNDTAEPVQGELTLEYWTYDGRIVSAETKSVTLPPDSSTEVSSFAQPQPSTFLVQTLRTKAGIRQNDWHFGFYKDMPLARARVNAEGDGQGRRIVLSTDRPAFFVWANVRGAGCEFSDNCLTLLPGRPQTLCLPREVDLTKLTVTHLADLCGRLAPSADGLTAETVCEFARDEQPEGLSALSRIDGDRYYSVNDRGGELYELKIGQNATGEVTSCSVVRKVVLQGRKDLEGCAWDPLEKRIWVSDEADASIRQFDPQTGRETRAVAVPDVFAREAVPNRSIEALAISPDGLRLYAANEDTLKCDGEVANQEHGGLVRIQEFVRAGAGAPWKASRQFRYPTEKIDGEKFEGKSISGVVSLCAEPDGSLLVLEREMSMTNPLFPSFHARLFQVRLTEDGATLEKHSVWDEDTMFSNYEGICRGVTLKDGTRTWVLVSDGGGKAEENLLVIQETFSPSTSVPS